MEALITLLPGDGIGPDVTVGARRVLQAVADKNGHRFEFQEALMGGIAIDETGNPLPDATRAACEASDAVLLGAVGGPKWSDPNAPVRPEQGLLELRALLGVYANLRPVKIYPELASVSPLKAEFLEGVDLLVVRELTGGIYFGEKTRDADSASDLCVYERHEIERIVRVAARLSAGRRQPPVLGRQSQYSRNLSSMAGGYRPHNRRGISGHSARDAAGRRRCHAPLESPGFVRRDRHRKHVWRYPDR